MPIAAAMGDIADRFRGRARALGKEATKVSDEALEFGNDALRTLTKEVEQRPLVTLRRGGGRHDRGAARAQR